MQEYGVAEGAVLAGLETARRKDIPYSRVLSAMCTHPHPIAVKAHMMFIETNLGDAGLFPGAGELEAKAVRVIGGLLGKPDVCGYITTGGTEANIQAFRVMRNRSNKKNPNIIVPDSAHFSFDKARDVLGIELRKAPLDADFRVDVEAVEGLIDGNTCGITGIAGTTEFGQVDRIDALSDIAIERQLPLHVDAAFGGFVIPFLDAGYPFDFTLDGVTSVTADPHKMGLSTIPAGGFFLRNREELGQLRVDTPYLTISEQYSLSGTRSGAAAASVYAVMSHLGRQGYGKIVKRCMDMTHQVVEGAGEIGIEPVIEPVMNITALAVSDVHIVRKKLRELGWVTSMTRNGCLRLVLMPHLDDEIIKAFLKDLKKVCL